MQLRFTVIYTKFCWVRLIFSLTATCYLSISWSFKGACHCFSILSILLAQQAKSCFVACAENNKQ